MARAGWGRFRITCDPPGNLLGRRFDDSQAEPQRLDYIFYQPSRSAVKDIRVLRDWKTPGGEHLSDPYPLCAVFTV